MMNDSMKTGQGSPASSAETESTKRASTDRAHQIIRTSWIGIATNVLLAGFKAVVGILSSSVAIVMDYSE